MTEYVTGLEHEPGCSRQNDRKALYLRREIVETQDAHFISDDDGEFISGAGEWIFEESLRPLMLRCTGCWASRYVELDDDENVVAMNEKNCPRSDRWGDGHFMGIGNEPCKYCGYEG